MQTGNSVEYTTSFRQRLLECTDVSDAEALDRFIAGLKLATRSWVKIHDPTTVHEAARLAERYDNTYHAGSSGTGGNRTN